MQLAFVYVLHPKWIQDDFVIPFASFSSKSDGIDIRAKLMKKKKLNNNNKIEGFFMCPQKNTVENGTVNCILCIFIGTGDSSTEKKKDRNRREKKEPKSHLLDFIDVTYI